MSEKPIYLVRLVIPWQVCNPDFDPSRRPDEKNPPFIEAPAGFEFEDEEAWIHCLPNAAGFVVAEPANAETAERVAAEEDKRLQRVRRRTKSQQDASKRMRKRFQAMRERLGVEESDKANVVDSQAAKQPVQKKQPVEPKVTVDPDPATAAE